ncbi:serine hydrolase domain-containing protein [Sphingomonas astaxanthinifaciens]|uniref:Beta-lactamase-related domain-containing protein n=1 Tax=Sphingomonas astaxanthinifaciens DSM 22298 TaxID=1123267 RepID=A0ABQ5Z9B9_9SPHN|nr:serine hydrolase domain-containing protein [Sphingomonas astaxanthinifaciens]GLR48207.1 hypothetical protein GCM10007925_19200 [Sphingomonas astaxanthinifaciens DSM 22298]
MRLVAMGAMMVAAATAADATPPGFPARASAVLASAAPADGPGIVAVVSENGRVVWRGAAGKANLATGAPLAPASLFRYASISKQFTAALVLKYVEDGRLGLDDDLGKLLPAETPEAWHKVTVRQLLNHTSGIPSYTSKPGFMAEANTARAITTRQLIDVTRDMPMDFAPGTQFRYNNTGYVLLSAIVEKLSGKPWYAALRERITGPLGLTSIRCGCEPGPAVVESYTGGNRPSQKIDMTVPSGAGALVGTAEDLARWAAALHGGKVVKPASYQAMITPAMPAGATEKYGFGLSLGDVRGLAAIGHNGGIPGFSTESIYVPSKKLFVAALANSDSGAVNPGIAARRLLAEAAGIPFPELKAMPTDLRTLEPLFGVYSGAGGQRRFFARDGKLYTQRADGARVEAYWAGGDRFFYGPDSLSYFAVATGADGKPVMTFHPNGALAGETLARTGPVPPEAAAAPLTPAQLDRLAGSYAFGPATMTIARSGAGLTAQLTGQPPIALDSIGPNEFRTVGVDARLVFEEETGKLVRVVLHQNGRTIPFARQ